LKITPINWADIEEKWRSRWEQAHVFESDPDPNKKKFFLTVAYPYPNSPQHIGHGRTYTLADVHARYCRMQGYNVLFPMAFHYTGTPILAMSRRLASGDQDLIDTFTRIYKVPQRVVERFSEPLEIARYFHEEIKQGMKEMGYSIDWRREFTTIDPQYSRFIEWQFEKLREKRLVTQGSHPVGWCPNCGNPVGQHDTVGDMEPEIGEFTLLKFHYGEYALPTATLRPETIFGVTNIWLHPEAEYVQAKVEDEKWIVSAQSVRKLRFLGREIVEEGRFKGRELIGKSVLNPVTGVKLLILPASFVDPDNATGVVMSVPGHAPYDYQALTDLKANPDEVAEYGITREDLASVVPVSIIEVEGYSDLPALDVIKRIGIKSQNDNRLEDATKEIYAHEFHSGRMKANTGGYAGLPVAKARDKVKEDLLQAGKADVMYEIMNRPVICRCGAECIVKIFEEQWFINYGNPEWKTAASECLNRMSILPEEIRQEFEYTIGWLREKACARKSGLGTKLPWDRDWIIESLSDSVIYMAYYTIARLLKNQTINVKQLTDEAFDYILLGKGELDQVSETSGIDRKILQSIREEFEYFYPLDSRHSGRDLVPNHLTFFIFNHVAIFPRENWPEQIAVNGSVLMEGKKMSKSFGNIIPLREAVRSYGADPLRLAMLIAAELLQDADFSIALTKALQEKLERFYTFSSNAVKMEAYEEVELTLPDKWLISRLQRAIKATTEAMNRLKVREAVHHVLYTFDQDLQWYLRRCSVEDSLERKKAMAIVLRAVLDARVRMLAPFAPYVCEEIWEKMGGPGFVSKAEWPKHDDKMIDLTIEGAESIIESTLDDTANIAKATKIKAKNVYYYTSAQWKWKVYLKALERAEAGRLSSSEIMRELVADAEMKRGAKELAKFVQKCCDDLFKMAPDMRRSRLQAGIIDEFEVLKAAGDFYKKETDAEVKVYREDDTEKYDPKNRAQLAQPYRPAIYIE